MKQVLKSQRLNEVCYDIRGPVAREAARLESLGHKVSKLNIGNPGAFSFKAPDHVLENITRFLPTSSGYCESKGILSAREAIAKNCRKKNFKNVDVDKIYIGNGVSELIVMVMQAMLNAGDEILIPAPDYPLWTASVSLSNGKPVHYLCDEENDWQPNLEDIKNKVTSNTKAIVLINPNNPTGAVYSRETLEGLANIAREHELVIFSDEIYDRILYDDAVHIPMASIVDDLPVVTFNGLSKTYQLAGFRVGWMIFSGDTKPVKGLIEGVETLASMRLCANAPVQHAIAPALEGHQDIKELLLPTGRLDLQRKLAWKLLNEIPGVSAKLSKGGLYLFAKIDTDYYKIEDDQKFILEFLQDQKVLLVQGSGFNWPKNDHFRVVYLASCEELASSLGKLAKFLKSRVKS